MVDEPVAAELLREYLDYRIATFPAGSAYRPSAPDPAVFTPAGSSFTGEQGSLGSMFSGTCC